MHSHHLDYLSLLLFTLACHGCDCWPNMDPNAYFVTSLYLFHTIISDRGYPFSKALDWHSAFLCIFILETQRTNWDSVRSGEKISPYYDLHISDLILHGRQNLFIA